jgi:transposase InsO family protein
MGFWNRKKKAPKKKAAKKEKKKEPPALPPGPEPKKRRSPRRKRSSTPLEVKLVAVKAVEAGLLVREVAELLDVSTTTVSSWSKSYRAEGVDGLVRRASTPPTQRICRELEARIVLHREQHPERGVRRISDELKRQDALEVSPETVRRVVNDAGLGNPPPQPKRKPPAMRRFERPLPNALWQVDIMTFQLKRMYPVYLVGIIDDHSRYIVGHGLFRQQTADAVLEVVRGAIGEWGAPREMLSDNGRQFVAWRGKSRFQKLMTRQGIGHVRSAPHHPMTLGKIERFWRTIWEEFLAEAFFASFADASQRIGHWVAYYNHQRPHRGIGGACPADRFYGVANDVEEAVRQGCQDNALRLALGQETRPPLFLLGKLGETDVRVTRKGEDIEVRLGDAVREVIRVGAPYTVDEDGQGRRQGAGDEVEGDGRGGAVSGGGAGPEGGPAADRDLRDLRREPADALPSHGQGGPGVEGGAGAEEAWPEGEKRAGREDRGGGSQDGGAREGPGPLEDEVRRGQDLPGPDPSLGAWGGAGDGRGGDGEPVEVGKKKAAPEAGEVEDEEEEGELFEQAFYGWERSEGGAEQ